MSNKNFLEKMHKAGVIGRAIVSGVLYVVDAVASIVSGVKAIFHSGGGDNNGSNSGAATAAMVILALAAGFFAGLLLFDASSGVSMAMAVVAGVAGKGQHAIDEPLTTKLTDTVSPGLLRNEIDDRIVKIRPMSTPLDQISRYGGARLCGSMKVDYYSVDTRPIEGKVTSAYTPPRDGASAEGQLVVADSAIFDPSTTLLVPEVKASTGGSLVLYVIGRDGNKLRVCSVNNTVDGKQAMPAIPANTRLVRMGRAAAELDVLTSQFEALPTKETNYCQIFKTQVEQSTYMKIANKEVGWTFSDQEEAAIIDMRMGMEKNFLFGHKCIITDPEKQDEILLTGGIWNQTDNTFEYTSLDTEAALVSLCKQAFTNKAGSTRKVLIGGTGLIEQLNRIDHTRVVQASQTVTKWGLDFTEIHSKFGTLYVVLSEVFDQCGMPDAGMVIDPEYITKYSHVPFRTERLDLRSAGVRNTDAIVITEASCVVLRYPKSHMRIVRKGA